MGLVHSKHLIAMPFLLVVDFFKSMVGGKSEDVIKERTVINAKHIVTIDYVSGATEKYEWVGVPSCRLMSHAKIFTLSGLNLMQEGNLIFIPWHSVSKVKHDEKEFVLTLREKR